MIDSKMAKNYNSTLNLPVTKFAMRGNLPKMEPEILAKWEREKLYYKMMEKNAGKPIFILHDGPPYANGAIHLGTALNKILKDFIVKYKNMSGFYAPYVPGWDTHGLPIELKVIKDIYGIENGTIQPIELRKQCHNYAMNHVANQINQFKRLGSFGDYEYPYLTLSHEYEARQVEVFGSMANKGYMYKGLKPVYWCPDCNTALAEAEIEYSNDPCYSIYVKFNVTDDKGIFKSLGLDLSKIYFVIWTTTTWTIPGNLAICLGPEYNYTLVHVGEEYYVMAEKLVHITMQTAGITDYTTDYIFTGADLEKMKTKHPLYNRSSPIIVGNHVTLESGTGCVHTAPGYGIEDFEVCKNYDNIGILVCIDSKGKQTAEAGEFDGMDIDQANKAIAAKLVEIGAMLTTMKIVHKYPHCWRCNSQIIYRATEQWFCSVNDFKDETVKAIEKVQWIPKWGENRIKSMVRERSDWCISRQRTWGVPIPVIYCNECSKPIYTDVTIKAIANLFRKEGSNSWWTREVNEFIPSSVQCECGCYKFKKEYDIMDVWFDSGVSHTAVMDEFENLLWPADLYLEGTDQYRGWFQSSLLTSVVYKGAAPYKAVCTHGWIIDGDDKVMHKSLGNGIDPNEITDKYGADILRLCFASSDYHNDIKISKSILVQFSEAYKKIRNTVRFMLSNLGDFDPNTDSVSDDKLEMIDIMSLNKLSELTDTVKKGYEKYNFHVVFHAIHKFCVVDMSNLYLDILKDRLYCEIVNSVSRRAAQTAMYRILKTITLISAPIISFTAEEIWQVMAHTYDDEPTSVFLNQIPKNKKIKTDCAFNWEELKIVRNVVNKALEEARNNKLICKSLEAKVTLKCGIDKYIAYKGIAPLLPSFLIVSQVDLEEKIDNENKIEVFIDKADGNKCERCWCYSKTVGENYKHLTLCHRCVVAVTLLCQECRLLENS